MLLHKGHLYFSFGRGYRVDAMGCPYKPDIKIGLKGSFDPKLSEQNRARESEKNGSQQQKVYSIRILVL